LRLHRNLAEAVVRALTLINQADQYADRVLTLLLASNPRWGARDRAFLAESSYEILRWRRLLQALLDPAAKSQNVWHWLGIWWLKQGHALPNWPEFDGLHELAWQDRLVEINQQRALRESIPDWLDTLGAAELGELWPETLHALNQPAPLVVRVNTLKTNRAQLMARFLADGIDSVPTGEVGLIIPTRQNLFKHPAFRDGWFEIQDGASQQVALALAVEPGMHVIDACAGGGGKSLQLAALMENRGKIISLDVETRKLDNLKQRARRAGAYNIETRLIESRKVIKRLAGYADRLLLDVPCSGLGVLRRNPDAKWKLNPAWLDEVRSRQQQILQDYASLCKVGGRLVYATCSILPSENQQQVAHFLAQHADSFSLLSECQLLPQAGFDGFYIATLTRHA